MKKFLLLHISIIFIFTFFSGCSLHKRSSVKTATRPTGTPSVKSNNPYYYYVKAELESKKGNTDKSIRNLKKAIKADPNSSFLKKELSLKYLSQKDIKNAEKTLNDILENDPEYVDAYIIYGNIKLKEQAYEDAILAFEKAISIDPEQENTYYVLGRIYMDEKDTDKALDIYTRLVKTFPDSYVGHFFLGKIFEQKNQFSDAEKKYKKTLQLKPELIEPRFELIKLYRLQIEKIQIDDKTTEAELNKKITTTYKDILEYYPQNEQALLELGYHYYQIGEIKKAEKIFKEMGEKSLSDQNILKKVVQLFVDTKEYDAATTVLEGMITGAPDNSNLHFIVGLVYYDGKKEYEKAIEHLEKVSPESRFYENAAIHIAFIYQQQNNSEKAISFLQDVIQKVPDNIEFVLYLGSIYEELKQYENAEKIFKKGLSIDPENTKLHYRLGVVYDKWGKKESSLDQMRTVIKIDPKDASALNYLGYSLAELNQDLDEAERLIKEALKYKPDDGYITDSLGWVYYKKNRYKDAVEVLKKAVSLVPDDPIVLEHLGDAYLKLNEKELALEFYEHSLKQRKKDKADIEKKIKQLKEDML